MKVVKYPSTLNPMEVVMNYVCERNRICPFCGAEMSRTNLYNMNTQTEYIGTKEKQSYIFEDPDSRILKIYNWVRNLFRLEPYRQYLALGFHCSSCKGERKDDPIPVYRGTPDIDVTKYTDLQNRISISAGSYDEVCGTCACKGDFNNCLKQIEFENKPIVLCSQHTDILISAKKERGENENP